MRTVSLVLATILIVGCADMKEIMSLKAAFARQVAEFIRDHYSHYSSLEMVNVGFSKVSKTGPVTVTSGEATYQFTTQDLGAPRAEPKARKTGEPV